MAKCTSCGKEHGMVIENMETGETTPIDWCRECFFTKGYVYKQTDIPQSHYELLKLMLHKLSDENMDYGATLRKAQDDIIREMMSSSGVIVGEDGQ